MYGSGRCICFQVSVRCLVYLTDRETECIRVWETTADGTGFVGTVLNKGFSPSREIFGCYHRQLLRT